MGAVTPESPRATGGFGPPRVTRAATPADIPAMRAIFRAHDGDTEPVTGGADVVGPYLAHLVASHRALVVDEAPRGVIAFGATLDTGRARMLCDLFVVPDLLGQGIGRPLLDALYDGAASRATFSSDDPRALPLYVRAGMAPRWINLYLEGLPVRLPDVALSLAVRAATPSETCELEASWTGCHRPADHAFWASQAAADTFVVEEADGTPVAVGFGRAKQATTARALDRLVIRPDADAVPVALAALCRAARGGPVQTCVLGPSPLLPVLLDAGFRIVDHDQLLTSAPDLLDPARLLPNPGML